MFRKGLHRTRSLRLLPIVVLTFGLAGGRAADGGAARLMTSTAFSRMKIYKNPDLNPAAPIQDTSAFAACP
jgi:hypothetical protein